MERLASPRTQWWAEILEIFKIKIQINTSLNSISKYFWKMNLKYFCLNTWMYLKYFENTFPIKKWPSSENLEVKEEKFYDWLYTSRQWPITMLQESIIIFGEGFVCAFFHSEPCVWPSHALIRYVAWCVVKHKTGTWIQIFVSCHTCGFVCLFVC